jgi:uncharacterized membrane protein
MKTTNTNIEVDRALPNGEHSTVNISVPDNREVNIEVGEALPEQVLRNVEAITSHQDRSTQSITADRRILNKIAAFFARPGFLYAQIGFFAIWIGCTQLAERNIIAKNFPQFDLHLHGLEIASLLISTEVLIAQAHQEKVEQERTHLAIQLDLVTEQKIAKLISLVEELRTDLPNVKNRNDAEADEMKQSIDPQAILNIIQHNANHTSTEDLETKFDRV